MPPIKSPTLIDIEENQITGYISLYRSLKKHWLWKASKVKSKAEAFISMVMDANHQTLKEPIGFDLVTVKRGQILTSQEKLSIEWKWTRNQVRSFLEMLKSDGMIVIETTTKFTMITICKYDSYQSQPPTKSQRANNKPPTDQQREGTNNNGNNYNNDNNIDALEKKPVLEFPFSEDFRKVWEEWKSYKKSEHKFNYKSLQTEQTTVNELIALSEKDEAKAIAIINQSIAKGWKGFFPVSKTKAVNSESPINLLGGRKVLNA